MQFSEENNVSHAYVEAKIVNKAYMNPLRTPNVSGMLFQASNNSSSRLQEPDPCNLSRSRSSFLRISGRCNRQSEFTLLHFTIFH